MSDKLLKCPFCGGKLEHVSWGYSYKHENGVQCSDCKILITSIDGEITKEELAEKVNIRKPMKNIMKQLEVELQFSMKDIERCRKNPLQYDEAKGYANGIYNAIEFVKEEYDICSEN